jgi:hypothetical protein
MDNDRGVETFGDRPKYLIRTYWTGKEMWAWMVVAGSEEGNRFPIVLKRTYYASWRFGLEVYISM